MPDRLSWGIIGPGGIAGRFAGQLPRSRTGTLLAVASRDADRAKAFGTEYGASRFYGDYQSLLDDPDIDAVYIATPHPMHTRWGIAAAEAGKHVLCEKPLSVNHALCMAMVEAARRNNVLLMEAYMYRCHPQAAKLTELVRTGAIGQVQHIAATFAFNSTPRPGARLFEPDLAGGGILDVGGYPVSISRLIAGAAAGAPFLDPTELSGSGHIGQTGVDEWATASLVFPTGVTAHVATGVRCAAENVVRVFGSEGYLEVPAPWLPDPDSSSQILVHRVGQDTETVTIPASAQYADEADSVADHAAEGESPAMSPADSLGNAATLDKWRAAIGLEYPSERADGDIGTAHGRPLQAGSTGSMPKGTVDGVGIPVSRLVMGVDNQPNLTHATVMFDDFVERGGNCFDTGYIYGGGRLERFLGQWIRNRGIRDDVVIIGKGAHTPHCDPESITSQLLETLDRLQTDHLDIYFMHRDNLEVQVGEFVDVLDEHYRAGRIRTFGGSNWTRDRFTAANEYAKANGKRGFTVLSNHLSLARAYDVPWAGCEHVTDPESRQWLTDEQITLFPWSSQARGFFTGRARPDDKSDAELVRCYYSDENFARLDRANELAARRGVPATAIALAYVLNQPFPTFPLFGPRTLIETETSMPALQVTLTPDEVRWLDTGA
ncbi:MAG TPA: aldo/keto reductase [Mycobacteriales bacterium]|nr:aldo/keto reductase [Mycobacteriales bacterium]